MNRRAGVLLHITSLPSKYGVGTLGKESFEFIDWLEKGKMKIWQVLPLVPTSYGDSPYQSVSSTALNQYLIDYDILKEKGLLDSSDYEAELNINPVRVDYAYLFHKKNEILRKAFTRFNVNTKAFKAFLKEGEYNDYSLYMTLKELNGFKSWENWPLELQSYSKELEERIIKENKKNYLFWQWTQYEFLAEWNKVKDYANSKGIEIMGDMPIYVAYDSVEVWKHPELFDLNPDKSLKYGAGCPPDAFCEDGQLWGNPIYNWDYHKSTGYAWWNERISKTFKLYDIIRIDHFRGFADYYRIPASEETARNGEWVKGPRFDLFKDKTNLKIVAEDLGFIDEPVRELLEKTNYPGMKVLQFGFDGDPSNEYLPSNATENYVIYTGTHDNMPLYQWIGSMDEDELDDFKSILVEECDKLGVEFNCNLDSIEYLVDICIELAYASKADTCIIPMQDLLHQDGFTRMNFPSTVSTDNWSYRISDGALSDDLASGLVYLVNKFNR